MIFLMVSIPQATKFSQKHSHCTTYHRLGGEPLSENVLPPMRSLLSTFHHSKLFFQLSLLQFTDFWMCTTQNIYSPITLPLPLTTNEDMTD
jgi:hypothetical protein